MPRNTHALTRGELAQAQFLYETHRKAQAFADERDPKRSEPAKRDSVTRALDTVAHYADSGFWSLTGRFCSQVASVTELNTVEPAEWTRSVPTGA